MSSRKKRFISIITLMCMAALVFAPGAFAQTAGASDEAQPAAQAAESPEPAANDQENGEAPDQGEENPSYKISTAAEPEAGGTVTVNKDEAAEGEAVTYTVTPAKGYKIASIKIGTITAAVTQPYGTATGIFTPAQDMTVKAAFQKLASYKITTSVNSTSKGTITASASVTENGSKTITAKAKSGYYLSDLQVDGKSVGAKDSYTLSNITANHTVKAVFSKQIKIMLDAGHYGKYNRSPVLSTYYESNMTWALHNYLKSALEKYDGFYVGVTRTNQTKDMNVYYRGTAAKGYDLFLSLHSNSSTSKTTDYPLIITQKGNTGDSLAKNLGKTIQTTMGTKQAYKVWQRLNSDGKTEYYGVLRGSKAAGVKGMIVEHSFHTNLAATMWLSSNTNLQKLAEAEAKVLADYYGLSKSSSTSSGSSSSAASSGTSSGASNNASAVKTVATTQKVKVLVSSLNMRKSYSTSSASMGKAKKNTTYQLKAKTQDGKWGQLKTNGYWIYLPGYTKVVTTSASNTASTSKTVASTQKVKVTVSSLNLRKSYSASSKSMG
ncbi:N-acetylmuramoyl-L-alanine amidase, partial [bacterium 210820-DFI.6.37]|nr:N-acetylmuramoyl-L-alanine amidase [bacterium 210820-DFI.6.37]